MKNRLTGKPACIAILFALLLVEYMNDGTIYNKAFNILCVVCLALLIALAVISFISSIAFEEVSAISGVFSNLSRMCMVFLFTFFAYDSAKDQLKKTNL